MRSLRYLLLMVLCACFAFANPIISTINHEKVMEEFNIENNVSNKMLVYSIYKGIPQHDRDLFRSIIKTKSRNAYLIKNEIDELEAPEFLLYLAMVESKLSNKATSGAKAAGMWQFMPVTARNFGLRIDKYVDERRDPKASTEAAFAYLSLLKKNLGKWYLAVMAYNCGEARLRKAIAKTGNDDFEALMSSGNLPKETAGFMKKIIRYSYIATSSDIRESLEFKNKPSQDKLISVAPGTKLASVAKSIGVSINELSSLNTHLKQGMAPLSGKYYFYIPENKFNLFVANYIDKKSNKNMSELNYQTHLVSVNENLTQIAQKWGVKVRDLRVANKLKGDKILVNQKLKIPIGDELLKTKKYIVQQGDTLIGISKKFEADVDEIIALNDIKNGEILVGDDIVIP